MMRWLIRSSLQLRLAVAAIAAMLIVFGFTQLRKMPVDALPEFSRPYVEIQILEADMLNGTPWAQEIRSVSLPGLASIKLIFEEGTDLMRARQVSQERMTELFTLPGVSDQITMINPVSSSGRCMEIGLTSDELSLIEMSVLARWTIVPRLMGLQGVSNVAIWGERQRQLQVQVDPERLRAQGLTLHQIIKTAGNSLWASPLTFLEASTPGTGGWIDTPNQRLGVRHILPIQTADDLAQVPIEGAPSKRLGDVTTVVEDHQPLIGDAIVDDAPSLMLVVEKFPWANTAEVTKEVEAAMTALQPAIAGIEVDPTLFRPATYLEQAVGNLSSAVMIGAVLAIIALFAFLFNWRTALISTTAILISVIAAGTVLYMRGVTINMMIVAGLLIAVGVVIDDAIVDVENVVRRLRQARKGGNDTPPAAVIFKALVEMRSPIFYATVVMALAVVPLLFVKGVSGAFWQPVAMSYLLALVASMAVALTITPALSLLFLRKASLKEGDSPVSRMLRGIYSALFSWAARTPRTAFVAVSVLALAGLLSLPFLRQESLLPDFKETDLVVRLEGGSGTSHPAMSRITTLASRELRALPGVRNVSAHLGRAIVSDKHTNINSGEAWVSIDPAADYEATVASVREVAAGYPGMSPEVLTNLQAKIRRELSGTSEALVVRVYGENMKKIGEKAEEVKGTLQRVDGITAANVQYPREMPTLEIEVDVEKARGYGLKPGDIRRSAATLVGGITVGSLFEEQKVFDVVVWGSPDTRDCVSSIQELLIDAPSGRHVRLKEVADVRIASSPERIDRDAVARYLDVAVDVSGRDLAAVATDVNSAIQQMGFPLEYRAELLGEYADRLAAQKRILALGVAAAIGIFLLFQAFFGNWRLATATLLTLPMALLGGVMAAFLTGGGLISIGSVIGFIAVFGMAVRNSLTLVSHYRNLEDAKGGAFDAEIVRQATRERSGPILMSAIATALVMLPMALLGSIAGLEIVRPMAVVILGGLVTSTLLSLFGVPAMYILFGARREPDLGLEAVTVVSATEVQGAMS
jgi:Cu/Ag efflux pump CusA